MKAQKKYLPLVYICSKYSGDTASPGMRAEINQAKKHHKTIRYFDNECRETFTEI